MSFVILASLTEKLLAVAQAGHELSRAARYFAGRSIIDSAQLP